MSTVDQAFDSALDALRERYVSRLPEAIGELKKFAVLCEFGEADAQLASGIRVLAHKLSGSGETLGFPEVSAHASSLERLLDSAGPAGEAAAQSARALARACEAAGEAIPPIDPALMAEKEKDAVPPSPGAAIPKFVALYSDATTGQLLDDVFRNRVTLSTCRERAVALAEIAAGGVNLLVLDMDSSECPLDSIGDLFWRAEALKIPVLAMTSQRRAAAILRAVSEGRIDCLLKPVAPADLHAKAFQILERGRLVALLCDDDRVVREFLKPRFEASGFQVQLAHDGEEVIELARRVRPSVIILDRCMPKLEGLAALRMLKSDASTHHIPVLMLTSRAQANDVKECLDAGAAAYMTKPFAPKAVVAKSLEILGARLASSGDGTRRGLR